MEVDSKRKIQCKYLGTKTLFQTHITASLNNKKSLLYAYQEATYHADTSQK